MDQWIQDFRYAVRRLTKAKGFTSVAVLSLALGIGANTAIFTVINAVFLHPLAIENPSRVVELFTRDTQTVTTGNFNLTPSSIQNYEDHRDQSTHYTGLAAYFQIGLQLTNKGETNGVPGMMTTANYFDVLGVKPVLGRTFTQDEDIKSAVPVAVLSHSIWATQFASDPTLVGKTVTLNGLPFSVIGIAPQGFKGTFTLAGPDRIWVPLGMRDQLLNGQIKTLIASRRFRWLNIVGRLKPGATMEQAQAAARTIASSLATTYPDANRGRTMDLAKETDAALGINQRPQFVRAGGVLMVVVGLVLLIACVNLANLLLAQAARREREITIRATMGASRSRLVRQLLIESVTLSMMGGVAGLVVAFWARNALWAFRPPFLDNAMIDLSFDVRVLAFTFFMSLFTGLAFGAVPAIKVSQTRLAEVLKVTGRSGSSAGHNRVRSTLVAAEIALATVALIGAGLFVRSMQAAQDMDLGFNAKHTGFIGLNPGGQKYEKPQGQQFYQDAIAKARAVPGVQSAAVAAGLPIVGGGGLLLTTFPEGKAGDSSYKGSLIAYNNITPGYFETVQIPLVKGRDFNEFDREEGKLVAIINEAVARQLWPGEDALAKRFTITQQPQVYEVVGVTRDSVINNVGEDPTPIIYRPMQQDYAPGALLVVRTQGDPATGLTTIRDQVQTLDKNMPIRNTGTVQEQLVQGLWASRMGAALLSIFGGLALALAVIGIYGVMAYSVSQRTQEIGIRMALGAEAADVKKLMLFQGMGPALLGAGVGVVAAAALGRPIANLLYGISPYDPITLASVTITLSAVALLACYVPARAATRVDPLVALRYE